MKDIDQGIVDPGIALVLSALVQQATMESQGIRGDGNAMVVLLDLLQNLLSQSGIEPPRNLEGLIQRTRRRQERRRRRRREAVSRHAYPTSDYQAPPSSGPVSDEVDSSRSSSTAQLHQSRGNSCTIHEQMLRVFLWTNGLCISALNHPQNGQTINANSESLAPDPLTPATDFVSGGRRRNSQTQRRRLRQGPKGCQADYQEEEEPKEE